MPRYPHHKMPIQRAMVDGPEVAPKTLSDKFRRYVPTYFTVYTGFTIIFYLQESIKYRSMIWADYLSTIRFDLLASNPLAYFSD